jgi:hypothetical protein
MSKKSDDATRIAGLASILKVGNTSKSHPPSPARPQEVAVAESPAPVQRKQKEQVGKYRDPNYHHYGFYLRRDTHKRVKRRLEDLETGKDISELLQELLEQWLVSQ